MKVYVASAFGNIPEVRKVMTELVDDGHEITHDWTLEALDPAWSPEKQAEYLQSCGAADFEGVLDSDAVVLVNHKDCRDSMTEFGIALGAGIPVYVLYPTRKVSVFFHKARGGYNDLDTMLNQMFDDEHNSEA